VKFLLDTNIISEIRKRDRAHPNVARWVAHTPVEEIGTSVMVLAKIRRGIELKRRRDPEQAKALDRWFAQMRIRLADRVLPIDEPIAEAWALLAVPDPLPLIDGLLAATRQGAWPDAGHPQRRGHYAGRCAVSRSVRRLMAAQADANSMPMLASDRQIRRQRRRVPSGKKQGELDGHTVGVGDQYARAGRRQVAEHPAERWQAVIEFQPDDVVLALARTLALRDSRPGKALRGHPMSFQRQCRCKARYSEMLAKLKRLRKRPAPL